jgi:hypothetical protein
MKFFLYVLHWVSHNSAMILDIIAEVFLTNKLSAYKQMRKINRRTLCSKTI